MNFAPPTSTIFVGSLSNAKLSDLLKNESFFTLIFPATTCPRTIDSLPIVTLALGAISLKFKKARSPKVIGWADVPFCQSLRSRSLSNVSLASLSSSK
jgi:hypothetical protein